MILTGWKNLIRTEYARTGNSTGKRDSSEDEEEDLDDYTLIKKMHDLTERYLTLDDGLSSAEKAAFLKVEIAEVAYAFYINNVFS